MPGPTLGTNLAEIADNSSQHPFINMFKSSRAWFTQEGNTFNTREADLLDLDEDGWVRSFTKDDSDAPFDKVATVLFTDNASVQPGRYIVEFEGEGTLEIGTANDVIVTQVSANRYTIDIPEGYTNSTVRIAILETDPNDTGDYLRDFAVFRESDEAAFDAGEIFTPEFLDKIEDFRSLRFMDWMQTNDNEESEWSDRLNPDEARYSNAQGYVAGVPVEVMVALANEVRADPWFTLPHQATDEYVREFATYVRDNLGDGLHARFEYSNEVWNLSFEQGQWAEEKAEADLGMEASDIPRANRQAYGIRAAEVAEIVAEVFGEETGVRAFNVFGTQAAFLGAESFALDAPTYVAQGYDAPRDAPFHIYAVAPYIGNGLGSSRLLTEVYEWISQGDQGFLNAIEYLKNGTVGQTLTKMANTVAYHSDVATDLGWQLEAYEGGQNIADRVHFNGARDPARVDFFNELVRRPEFADLYTEYFETWRDNGGGLMEHFTDIKLPGQYGSLGLWDTVFSDNTPRADALEDWRDNEPLYWDDDRPASTFESTVTSSFDFGTEGADDVNLGAGDNQYDALGGKDSVMAGAGDDTVVGGEGADFIRGQDGDDLIYGDEAADKLVLGAGNDEAYGDVGNDDINGGEGHDRINGGEGVDVIRGGRGDDELTDTGGNTRVYGEAGDDTIATADDEDVLRGGSGDDLISAGGGADEVFGNDDNDTVLAGAGDDDVDGGNGDDLVYGDAGEDRLVGGDGHDELLGGSDDDSLIGNKGNDTLRGEDGDDRISAQFGDDVIEGGAGNDFLRDGLGNDTVNGGTGNDTIELSYDDDTVVIALGDGHDIINNFDDRGDDVFEFVGFGNDFDEASEVLAAASEVGNDVLIDFGGGQTILLEKTNLSDLGSDDITFG